MLGLVRDARPHLVQADPETEGYLDRLEERHDELRALVERMFVDDPAAANEVNIAGANHNLFYVELHSGNREAAREHLAAARAWIFAHENAYLRPYVFLDCGVLALHDGDDEAACRLVACADRIFRDTDSIPDPDDYVELETATATLRERLDSRFDAIWAEGRALGDKEAQQLAWRGFANDPLSG